MMPSVLPEMQLLNVCKPLKYITQSAGNSSHGGGGPGPQPPNYCSSFRNQYTNQVTHAGGTRPPGLCLKNRCISLKAASSDLNADCWPHPLFTARSRISNRRSREFLVFRGRLISLTPSHFSATRPHAGTVDIGLADSETEGYSESEAQGGSLREGEPSLAAVPPSATILAEGHAYQIREATLADLRAAASVQADVFYEGGPIPAWDGLFLKFFQAEVYDTLLQKVRRSLPGRYACLVAIRRDQCREEEMQEKEADELAKETPRTVQDVVGIVDVAALGDLSVLRELEEVEEYLYVSGMAVATNARRSGVGSLLLEGVEKRGLEWGFHYLVLHVYEDNVSARKLYQNSGYLALTTDPQWSSTLLGRRRRIMMAKRIRTVKQLVDNVDTIEGIDS